MMRKQLTTITKFMFFCIILAYYGNLNAQDTTFFDANNDTVSILDPEGRFYVEVFDSSTFIIYKRDYYGNGQIKHERMYKKGAEKYNPQMGIEREWFENGNLYMMSRVKDGFAEGTRTLYYPTNKLKTKETVERWQTTSGVTYDTLGNEIDYIPIKTNASFPGGEAQLNYYLSKTMVYPRDAIRANIQGIVYSTFVVETTGEITGIKILRGLCESIDQVSIDVIESMPLWTPGTIDGKKVRVQFNLPLRFRLGN